MVATGSALLGTFPAYAASSGLDEIDCEPTAAELEDIGFIAEQDGIPLDEAIARRGWQTCFGEVAGYLNEVYPDEYAGATIVDGGQGAWIAFKDDVPEEAAELVAAIPVPVELIGGKGFSEAELNETLQALHAGISSDEEVAAASGGYDIETGVITINAQPLETLSDPAQRERLRQMLQSHQPANPAITVEVVLVDEVGGGDDTSSRQAGNPTPAAYACLMGAALLALGAGLFIRGKRRRQ